MVSVSVICLLLTNFITPTLQDNKRHNFNPKSYNTKINQINNHQNKLLERNISVHDNRTRKKFSEDDDPTYDNMPLYSSIMVALPTASVVNFFISGKTKLKKCTLNFDNTTIDLDLNKIVTYKNADALSSRLLSFGGNKCGYKINNLNQNDSRKLVLYAIDDKNKVYKNMSSLVMEDASEFLINRSLEVSLGEEVGIQCGDTFNDIHQKFCYLYNPKGEMISHDQKCSYHLDIVTIDDLGTWRCLVGYNYIMDVLEFTTDLINRNTEYVGTFTENTSDYYTIGCQLMNYASTKTDFCRFTRPDGIIFKVATGGATINYNTIGTDLENGKCVVQILRPLKKEDKGTWKCEILYSKQVKGGAFIHIETVTTFPYAQKIQKNVRLGSAFTVDCQVPYSSDFCFIVAPDGTQFKPDDNKQITAGLCSLSIEAAVASHNGTWNCSIAQKNGVPDEVISVEISIIELKVIYSNCEAAIDETAELICNTNGIPIEYCRFVSPGGLSYTLKKENSSTSRISYKGRGLEYGDCGITILKVKVEDQGRWNCYISSGKSDTNKQDVAKKIEIYVNAPSFTLTPGESVAVAFGVLAVVIATGGFVFYEYRRRRRRVTDSQDTLQYSHRSSSESGETVTFGTSQLTNYNT